MANERFTSANLPEIFAASDVIDAITQALGEWDEDANYKAGIARVVPGALKTYGVRVPDLRAIAKAIGKQYKKQTDDLIGLSVDLWKQKSREHRLIALFVLAGLRSISTATRWELGVRFLPDISDWEICDQMCHALTGAALAEDPRYMDELESWIADENLWVRRVAIVSTILLRRANYPHAAAQDLDRRALEMCARLLDDDEHYIRKAVDWAVREVIKRHEGVAYGWMLEQAQAGLSSVGRSTLKLAAKKLPAERQGAFLEAVES